MEALRFQVVGEAFKKKPLDVKTPSARPYEYFGIVRMLAQPSRIFCASCKVQVIPVIGIT